MTLTSSQQSTISMILDHSRRVLSRRFITGAAALSLGVLGGCSNDGILEVIDPDLINPESIETVQGLNPLRLGALSRFVTAYDGSTDSFMTVTGNLADELRASDTFDGRLLPNKRFMNDNLSEMTSTYLNMQRARATATNAIQVINRVMPTPTATTTLYLSELYMYRAYMENAFGEMYCSGVPFSESDGVTTVYGDPQTTVQVYTRAAASFDSSISRAGTNTNFLYGSQVGKARVLLNLGQFANAAAAVAGVPTTFKLLSYHCFGGNCTENGLYSAAAAPSSRYAPSKNEGINGLDFLPTTPDPRLPWVASTRAGFNTLFQNVPIPLKVCPSYRGTGCPGTKSDGSNVIADGIEARLIEAEARLQGGTTADYLAVYATLNTLRATGIPGSPITALTVPAAPTKDQTVTALFNERAYWMYLTGHRLGDLRRLIRQYGRDAETVFPTGEQQAPLNGPYGTDVAFPIPAQEKNNPKFTGCLDNKA